MFDWHTDRAKRIAKEGFRFARDNKHNWIAGVNCCPYGPGVPGNHDANAWYAGWWFFFYIIKPWADLMARTETVTKPPIGIEPRFIWMEKRRDDLYAAIQRYRDANFSPLVEWLNELAAIERELQSHSSRPGGHIFSDGVCACGQKTTDDPIRCTVH